MSDPALVAQLRDLLVIANRLPTPLPEPYLSFFAAWADFNDNLIIYFAEQEALGDTIHDMTLALAKACKDGELFITHDELPELHGVPVERLINRETHDTMWRIATGDLTDLTIQEH